MLRTIVVPLDGSRFAEAALGVAARLARMAGARLKLVEVHEPQMALVPVADIPISTGADDLEVRAQRQEYLADAALRLGTVGGGPVTFELVDGLAGPALAQWIEHHEPDLVVMSSHGRGPLSRFWLGSIADHLIRHVSVPILLLRPKDGDQAPVSQETIHFNTAIVPLDLSTEAEAILGPLTSFAKLLDTHLTLFHVVEPILGVYGGMPSYPAPMSPDLIEATRTRAQHHLDELADRLRANGLRVATKVVFSMGIAGTVLRELEDAKKDFVALTTHGATGFRRLLMGSVADKIIRGADRPVLILRPSSLAT
jgi:nucleotide-binding universal stress UspA family protein